MISMVREQEGKFRFVYASPSAREVTGWSAEELLQLTPADLYTRESMVLVREDAAKIGSLKTSRLVLEAVRKDGRHIWVENRVRAVQQGPEGTSVVVCTRDVTEQKLLEDQLSEMALVDALTGIGNRRAFDQALEREWKRASRAGWPLSLAMLDVDHFKLFNDDYGHQAGDNCLRAIAAAVAGSLYRPGDVVARYGGEEFALLFPETDLTGAEALTRRLREAVAGLRVPHRGNAALGGVVTISGGVSTMRSGDKDEMRGPLELLMAADAALYRAKRAGRNRVEAMAMNRETAAVE